MKKRFVKQMTALAAASALTVTGSPLTAFAYGEYDVSSSTFKNDTDQSEAFKNWKQSVWNTEKADSGKIALTPGKTEQGLRFAWYAKQTGTPAVKIWKDGQKSAAKIFTGSSTAISAENWQGNVYTVANKVSIEDYFEEKTSYHYAYTDAYTGESSDVWSEEYDYQTGDASDFSVILTGDPQIGASGSSSDYSADDASAARDAYNWDLTMKQAMKTDEDAVFLLSAGDQINQSGASKSEDKKTRESEYAGYLYSSVFRSLPIASTIGNHDMAGEDYSNHFNNPNAEDSLGATAAGSDYYFSYGDVLFISLNSNNRNQEEHRALMNKAVESNADAKWKVVIFHSDIYGSGQPHADTDAATNRIIFAPLMDEFGIDLCLTGHDHTYSRSYQILDGNVMEYDISDGSVTNPEGTLYITTGSGSGSKYYNLLNYTPYYIAERTNACLPAFSTIDFSNDALTIKTYDYEGNTYADSFTIKKTEDAKSVDETILEAEELLNSKDVSVYTPASVEKLQNALAKLKEVREGYRTKTDASMELIATAYGTETDPVIGYGSVANNEDKDMVDGNLQNRFKQGYSTLLDKTIYTQLNGETLPLVDVAELLVAQKAVTDGMAQLTPVEKETESEKETETKEDDKKQPEKTPSATLTEKEEIVKTGDHAGRMVVGAVSMMLLSAGVMGICAKKENE